MQPASGGYLEAVPLTSFVLMSLAANGRADHPVSEQAVAFLEQSVRSDGSWPIDTNLATWNTTLAINALVPQRTGRRRKASNGCSVANIASGIPSPVRMRRLGLVGSQRRRPDADDTAGALVALSALTRHPGLDADVRKRSMRPHGRA